MLIMLSMFDMAFPLLGSFFVFGVLAGPALFFGLLMAIIFAGLKGGSRHSEQTINTPEPGRATHKDDEPVRRVVDVDSQEVSSVKISSEDMRKLREAEQNILEGRNLAIRIKDSEVRTAAADALDASERIIKVLRNQPDEIRRCKQFLNYYVPTLNVIIKKYRTVESSGLDMSETKEKVIKYFKDILKALQKQYESLFDNDKLDLSVEMEAMQLAFKRDGMISEDDIRAEQEGTATI
ncbi:MAG: 5-bromo-4-chloroindolyl phosphate hydrolysis family protein [Firmicutes bacterium]|nr:5-bromo-4-chloroindolyl phosphate hydrolysis family protein [Bacillota bacterium]